MHPIPVDIPWLICVSKCIDQQSLQKECSHGIAWNLSSMWNAVQTEHIWDRALWCRQFEMICVCDITDDWLKQQLFDATVVLIVVSEGVGSSPDCFLIDDDFAAAVSGFRRAEICDNETNIVTIRSSFAQSKTLTNNSEAFSRYFVTTSLMHQRCSSRSVFASDGAHFIILLKHSTDSFSNLSTSSTVRQS